MMNKAILEERIARVLIAIFAVALIAVVLAVLALPALLAHHLNSLWWLTAYPGLLVAFALWVVACKRG